MSWHAASRIGFVVAVLAIVGLVWQQAVLAGNPFAAAVQGGAAALMVWARVVFGRRSFHASADPTEGGLVTSGPYRFIRHPIYAAVLLFLVAGVSSHMSGASVLLLLVAGAGLMARIVAEERLVVQKYPDYVAYAARTKRLIPFVY